MIGRYVLSIGPNAVDDEKLGPTYILCLALGRTLIGRRDRLVKFATGMIATDDIMTAGCSFLSYRTILVNEAPGSALRE